MSASSESTSSTTKVFTGATLIDGTGGPPVAEAVVVVEGDRIQAAGPVGQVEVPAGAEAIDVAGKWLIPGLINCHAHLCLDGSPDTIAALLQRTTPENTLIAAVHASDTLRAGVTAIRDLGSTDGIDFGLKKAVNQGLVPGPRMLVSGRLLCMTGGHGHFFGREVDGADEARKGAREQLKAGADVIKLMATGGVGTPGGAPGSAQLTYEELRAAIEEAEKTGKSTATHAQGTVGIKNAIRAGIDSIEHGFFLDDEAIDMMLERGTFLVPTLSPMYHILESGQEAGIPRYMLEKASQANDAHQESFRQAHEAGVPIAAGNDGGTPFNRADNLASELECMVANGMTPAEALDAAHRAAARLLRMDGEIGTIEPGKLADMVVLDADPLADISAVRAVRTVVKGGVRVR
jgi:imidazolonepropionase-like amidohydrolase